MGIGGMNREFFNYCPKCGENMDKKFGTCSRCFKGARHDYYYYKCPKCYYSGKHFRNDNSPCVFIK